MSTIWVLVTDSARARLLEADGPRGALSELQELEPSAESAATQFAREIGDTLNQGWKNGDFDRLVLCAPPRFLGTLQEELPDGVLDCVGNKVDRDLTVFTDLTELRHHLPERLCSGT